MLFVNLWKLRTGWLNLELWQPFTLNEMISLSVNCYGDKTNLDKVIQIKEQRLTKNPKFAIFLFQFAFSILKNSHKWENRWFLLKRWLFCLCMFFYMYNKWKRWKRQLQSREPTLKQAELFGRISTQPFAHSHLEYVNKYLFDFQNNKFLLL